MEKNTTKTSTASELLSKRLFEITPEEVKGAFISVDVQLQKTKRGNLYEKKSKCNGST